MRGRLADPFRVGCGLLFWAVAANGSAQEAELSGLTPIYSASNPNQVIQAAPPGTSLQPGTFIPRFGLYSVNLNDGASAMAAASDLGLPPQATFEPGKTSSAEAFGMQEATYLAYLPPTYRAEAAPPLVFAFSPVGDADRIVEVLRPVAREKGWVVVGCNGPRDGRDDDFYPTVREIMLDVRRRIPHNRNREYLSGFSGGAMASYRLSRVYWDEFAGILAFGGWLGLYDQSLVYPSRLAAALVNGRLDEGANQYEKQDRRILEKFGVRSKVFRFDGGHQYPGTETIAKAVDWLDDEWQRNGERQSAHPQQAAADASRLSEACLSAEHSDECTQAAVDYLLHHPQTAAADAARFLLARSFARSQEAGQAAFSVPPDFAGKAGVILFGMFQGLSEIDRPLAWALLETAHNAAPKDARVSARLSLFILQSEDPSVRSPDRALQMALQATKSDAKEWTGWFARGLSEGELGRTGDARKSLRKAFQLAPNWAQRMCRQALGALEGEN